MTNDSSDQDYVNLVYSSGSNAIVARHWHGKYSAGRSAATVTGAWGSGTLTVSNSYNSDNKYTARIDTGAYSPTWSNGVGTFTLRSYNNGASSSVTTGASVKVNMPSSASWSSTKVSGTQYAVTCQAGGKAYNSTITVDSYDSGWFAAANATVAPTSRPSSVGSSLTIKVPSTSTVGSTSTRMYTMVNNTSDQNYVNLVYSSGSNAIVAQHWHGQYTAGAEAGWDAGITAGWEDGHTQGYEQGYAQGIAQATDSDYQAGYDIGYEEGKVKGWYLYYHDNEDWNGAWWNSDTGMYEVWIPKQTPPSDFVGNGSSATSEKWFEYSPTTEHTISVTRLSRQATGAGDGFIAGCRRLTGGWTVSSHPLYYKFSVACGNSHATYYFIA